MKRTNERKKIIIIGGGISGITSGIYAQKNNFDTEIYEKNPRAGGLCTSWVRKNLPIDGCIHWMTGTKKGTGIYQMWREVDGFSDQDIIRDDNLGTIETGGKKVVLWTDLNKFEKELIEIAPEDTKRIKRACKRIRAFQKMPLPIDQPVNTMNLFDLIKIGVRTLPYFFEYARASTISVKNYCEKFKNPIIKNVFSQIISDNNSLYSALYVYGTTASGNGGVPKGGSEALIDRMVCEYKNCGGILHTAKEINEIIIKDKKAVGIKLKNGEEKYADYIIAACSPFHTKELLKNKYKIPAYEKRSMKSKNFPLPSCVLVSCAANYEIIRDLKLTSIYTFDCEPFLAGKTTFNTIKIRDYSYDEHFIKNGKVLLSVLVPQFDEDFFAWDSIQNREKYLAEKSRIGQHIINEICKRFPTLKNNIELLDVASPLTFKRYTNAFRGAYMPFALTGKNAMMLHNGKIKGIKNLYLSSQWQIMPGGLPVALMTGKFAIQRILKKEKRFFRFSKIKNKEE